MKKNRIFIVLVCLLFMLNSFNFNVQALSSNSSSRAIGNVNIVSEVDTSLETIEAWARSKNATETFVGLAKLYKQYAKSRGGVNWVLAYVQAAKETGYGKFGGVLDESYHNPCGLKNPSGGDDYDANAHKKFDNWDQGVIAHLDHLALYAAADGYPKTSYVDSWKGEELSVDETYDPRHTGWFGTTSGILGKAKDALSLTGSWASDLNYGIELFRLYCDATKSEYLPARSNLESPSNSEVITNGKLRIKGWALHAFGIKEIKVLVDNSQVATISTGVSRSDVNSTYPGYFNGANSGFDETIDISNLGTGNKTVEVKIIARNGETQSYKRNIIIKGEENTLPFRYSLDEPVTNEKISSNSLKIRGWALAGSGVKEVRVYVDGTDLGTVPYGTSRADVNSVYPGYSSGNNAGFDGTINLGGIPTGEKTLKIKITANDGTTQVIERTFTYRKAKLVVVDPGHEIESVDPGAIATHNGIRYVEGNLNLQIAIKLKAELEARGIEVYMTRYDSVIIDRNSTESLRKRVKAANDMNADLFVSIHHNSFTSSSANGFEVYYSTGTPITTYTNERMITEDGRDLTLETRSYASRSNTDKVTISKGLATAIANEASSTLGLYNRKAKDSNLYVCKNTTMPSILIENGFLTNPTEASKVSSASHQQKLAEITATQINEVLK